MVESGSGRGKKPQKAVDLQGNSLGAGSFGRRSPSKESLASGPPAARLMKEKGQERFYL
jgi:hypothetical protein